MEVDENTATAAKQKIKKIFGIEVLGDRLEPNY